MMKLLKKTLLLTTLILPGIASAAMLRFDITASKDSAVGEIGLLSGSYFIVDTSVANSSANSSRGLFTDSIVAGHIEAFDPFDGQVSTDLNESNMGSIIAKGADGDTRWTIPLVEPGESDPPELIMNFSGLDLVENLLDDASFYNDNFIDGYLSDSGTTISINTFSVSELEPAPVPIPPTFLLMASSLGLLLWRSNLSFSNLRGLLAST
jgi:hypothetical protein